MGKLRNEQKAVDSARDHGAETMDILILANQIRAHCQKDGDKIKSAKHLKNRMIELIVEHINLSLFLLAVDVCREPVC